MQLFNVLSAWNMCFLSFLNKKKGAFYIYFFWVVEKKLVTKSLPKDTFPPEQILWGLWAWCCSLGNKKKHFNMINDWKLICFVSSGKDTGLFRPISSSVWLSVCPIIKYFCFKTYCICSPKVNGVFLLWTAEMVC